MNKHAINKHLQAFAKKQQLAIAGLTEEQFADALRQALPDFQRLLHNDGQRVIYLPAQDAEMWKLRYQEAEARSCIRCIDCKHWHGERHRIMSPDKPIWKSRVWHEDQCFYVSTIERDYETIAGTSRGWETIAWEWDLESQERGAMVHQGGALPSHGAVCKCLMRLGRVLESDDDEWRIYQ